MDEMSFALNEALSKIRWNISCSWGEPDFEAYGLAAYYKAGVDTIKSYGYTDDANEEFRKVVEAVLIMREILIS